MELYILEVNIKELFKHSLELFQKYDGQIIGDVNWILK